MTKRRIYVAGPYSKPDPAANTRKAIDAGEELWAAGFVPFVPHLTHFWHLVSPRPWVDWMEYDLHWLTVCDAVLRLPGESPGADQEVARAGELGIPVFHSLIDLLAWTVPKC